LETNRHIVHIEEIEKIQTDNERSNRQKDKQIVKEDNKIRK